MATILIVEDDFDLQFILRSVFSKVGYTTESTDGDVDRFFTTEKKPDVVLLDMELNNKNGCDICRSLKKDKLTNHIPVIMMSANDDAEIKCKAAGADQFLPKPLNQNLLLQSVRDTML
jgi:two-component system phosphate regulon response regulator PhoB